MTAHDLTRAGGGGHDVSDEPRDESGKWTEGGGGGDGGDKETGSGKGPHPGKGYSKNAYVDSKGVIHTNNVYDAQRALFEDRKVELKQLKQVSTLIKRLGETAAEMAEHGETAPTFNLCNVSIEGTNLFCAESKGIPRVEMPVIPAKQTKAFVNYLKSQGYKVEKATERADHLRATQNEISGAKVAASMKRIDEEGFYKRLVVSRDDYILDGHHTWAGQLGVDARDNSLKGDKTVKISRVDISITQLLAEAEKWTGGKGKKPASEAAKGFMHMLVRRATSSLYVHRDLQNVEAFTAWAQAQGFDDVVDDPHVTVLYSKTAVDWSEMGRGSTALVVLPGGARNIEQLGDEGAVVLRFESKALAQRHDEMVESGASHDYDEYLPHVTINLSGVIPDGAVPYDGELVFGPEIFETITDGVESLKKTGGSKQAKGFVYLTMVEAAAALDEDTFERYFETALAFLTTHPHVKHSDVVVTVRPNEILSVPDLVYRTHEDALVQKQI